MRNTALYLKSLVGKLVMHETQRSIVLLKITPKFKYVRNKALYFVSVYTPPIDVLRKLGIRITILRRESILCEIQRYTKALYKWGHFVLDI